MISNVTLHNFKAFEDLSVDLGPITLLVGPNNSGKSSILASLRLLAQTIESFDPQTTLLLGGTLGDFGTYKDIVYGNHRGRPIRLSVTALRKYRNETWPTDRRSKLTLELEYKYRARRRELVLRSTKLRAGADALVATRYSEESERQLVDRVGNRSIPSAIKSTLTASLRMENFIPYLRLALLAEQAAKKAAGPSFLDEELVRREIRSAHEIADVFRSIDYIGAMRISPSRTYLFTGERRQRIGATGENAAGIMVMDTARPGSRSRQVVDSLRVWFRKAGIASDVSIVTLSDRHYEIQFRHPMTGESQNLADVGYGGSQVLPVLIGGYSRPPNSIYIVEEPEIHLHPRAQAELGDFFLELHTRGVQSLVETHSEHLVVRLQQYVAQGLLPPNHLQIYYVYPKGTKKRAKRLRLDKQGRFIDKWPHGFFPERLEEAKQLARIRFNNETKQGAK